MANEESPFSAMESLNLQVEPSSIEKVRIIANEVWSFPIMDLILYLDLRALSVEGSLYEMRCRMLRWLIRQEFPAAMVPWDESDERGENSPFTAAVAITSRRSSPSASRTANRISPPPTVTSPTGTVASLNVSRVNNFAGATVQPTFATKTIMSTRASDVRTVSANMHAGKSIQKVNAVDKEDSDTEALADSLRERLLRLRSTEPAVRAKIAKNKRSSTRKTSQSSSEESSDSVSSYSTIRRSRTPESHSSSSEEDSKPPKRAKKLKSSRRDHVMSREIVKSLQSWNITFSGRHGEKPDEFLRDLDECRECMDISTSDTLRALPSILKGDARSWYRTERANIRQSWKAFKKIFRRQFVSHSDDDELMDELRARTQAQNERMSSFLTKFRAIAERFHRPLSRRKLVHLAYKNLSPDYRKFVRTYKYSTFDDLLRIGKIYEKEQKLDSQYRPPKSKFGQDNANASTKFGRNKVATVNERRVNNASDDSNDSERRKPKPKKKKAKAKNNKRKNSEQVATVTADKAKNAPPPQKANNPPVRRDAWQRTAPQAPTMRPLPPAYRNAPAAAPSYSSARNTAVPPNMPWPSRTAVDANTARAPVVLTPQAKAMRDSLRGLCFNCNIAGHDRRACPYQQMEEFCYRCGTRQVTFRTCHNCHPQQPSGNEAARTCAGAARPLSKL